jgi:YD repeat-containing protein
MRSGDTACCGDNAARRTAARFHHLEQHRHELAHHRADSLGLQLPVALHHREILLGQEASRARPPAGEQIELPAQHWPASLALPAAAPDRYPAVTAHQVHTGEFENLCRMHECTWRSELRDDRFRAEIAYLRNGGERSCFRAARNRGCDTLIEICHLLAQHSPALEQILQLAPPLIGTAREAEFLYDDDGNLTRRTDPNNIARNWTYNAHGFATVMTDELGEYEQRTYTPDGLPLTVTNRDGSMIGMDYDAMGRQTYKELQPALNYGGSYDEITTHYDGLGRDTLIENTNSRIKRTFRPEGTLWTEEQYLKFSEAAGKTFKYEYTYNKGGARTKTKMLIDGVLQREVDYGRGPDNLMTSPGMGRENHLDRSRRSWTAPDRQLRAFGECDIYLRWRRPFGPNGGR